MTFKVWALLLVTSNCTTSFALRQDGALLHGAERTRRSVLPGTIGKVLAKSKTIVRFKNFGLYQKQGGYTAALSDFTLMKPTNIRTVGTTKFGRLEDKHVVLYKLRENTWINIWTNKKLPEGSETWSKIYYTQ